MAQKDSTITGSIINVDFSGTTAQGLVDKGIYQAVVKSAEPGMSQNNAPKITFKFEILDGPFQGRILFLTNTLQSHALFSFRKTLEALGVDVPQSAMGIDTRKLVGGQLNIQVDHEEYQGVLKAKVVDVAPIHYPEGDEPGAEDPEPLPMKKDAKPAKKAEKAKPAADPEDPENDI
jgi:hypothetical protein